ncbi:putative bifunctional diguanylate cyclase/phosphodiesterase [Selenomonas sp.]|uniref:putative bifunctional diguanylate cyclase/phosphodiesterase n=1 Tax=Selenomonas sp. TaxID=2053611 RepID=UPI003FA321CA
MEKKPVMMIVDDEEMHRAVLAQFFQAEYELLEATNGRDVMALLAEKRVDVILLDLVMPGMDGFALLAALKRDERLAAIPVIVTTAGSERAAEVRAMEMGAADFITKPYHPAIVCCRVKNVMARMENEWRKLEQAARERQILEMRHHIEVDALTGIYNRETFYEKTVELLQQNSGMRYNLLYFDINCFKIINDLFHVETGNLILKTAGTYFKTITEGIGLAGHMEADHFAVCMPDDMLDIDILLEGIDNAIFSLGIKNNILFYAGIYSVDDVLLPVDQMCDRAHMALNTIKGRYKTRYAYYDEKMRETLLEEQMMLREMEFALSEGQFCVYYQPVYSIKAGRAVSAEALVRWQHPAAGLIPPVRFVPLFERNGFVVRLDRFAWEDVCRMLSSRIRAGLPVVPVSVNVSRLNFYDSDFCDTVVSLLKKYDLDPSLLRLEITESAYTDNPTQLMNVLKKLQSLGLKILMDDFGSGYSSLNMLRNLAVDILKIDMSFVRDLENSQRAPAILRRVVEMAHDLRMGIVVEGVETKAQLDFLSSIGCDKIQGYYFAKPMPQKDFLARIEKEAER